MREVEGRTSVGVRLVLLLAAQQGRSLDELCSYADRAGHLIRGRLNNPGRRVRVSIRKADPVVSQSAAGVDRSDFDAVIDVISVTDDAMELIAAAKGLVELSDGLVDPHRSVAVAGREFVVRPGQGAVQIHFCLRRLPTLTPREFQEIWSGEFADAARTVEHVTGYRQVEVDAQWAIAAADATGLEVCDVDGVAVEWFGDDAEFKQAVAKTTADSGIVTIGQRLMDMQRSLSLLSETGQTL